MIRKFKKKQLNNGVKAQNDSVLMKNVEQLSDWATGYQNAYMECLVAAMNTIGERTDYEYLMGISGAAFRLQIGKFPEWCGMSADSGRGFDCIGAVWHMLGYSYYRKESGEFMGEGSKKNKKSIIKSIKLGWPVIAMDLEDDMNWGLILGCSKQGDQLLCRTKISRSKDYSSPKKWPWLVNVYSKKKNQNDKIKVILFSLKIAVLLSTNQF